MRLANRSALSPTAPDAGALRDPVAGARIEPKVGQPGVAGVARDVACGEDRQGLDMIGALGDLLARAQRADAVRGDADAADVKALITGCLARMPPETLPPWTA